MPNSVSVLHISSEQMEKEFIRILRSRGFSNEKSETIARVFTENSLDGVYSHGVNRFSRFVKYVDEKCIDTDAEPEKKSCAGAIEQWDGNSGPGILNAIISTSRAMKIADEFGIGCVALANTNHWMRGGTYGWQAAKAGYAFIGWTNTTGNMPAWGAIDSRLGNNPLVIAVPYKKEAIVLDMAASQFSYGKMEAARNKNESLPLPGGYDKNGNLTTDPSAILETGRLLPMGYWKGSGMALLLDLLAAILAGGLSTHEITRYKYEHNLSQIFIAINILKLGKGSMISKTVNDIIDDFQNSLPASGSEKILYPGERVLRCREENSLNSIPVELNIWEEIISL
ncbi:MAG: 3-dehydro-L-gulonate 2-dehydrogenase [Melioribacteraceae bacterium]